METYKIIQVGCGKMSTYTMKYAIEKGYQIVGAVDISKNLIGKDISSILGGNDAGVIIESVDNLKSVIDRVKPDVAIVTTTSLIGELDEILTTCAECGVNAITTCEEAFYPSVSNPKLTEKLDNLAKQNNCTITGTGYQDVFWGNLNTLMAGTTHKITKIKGSSSYNVEDYGIALAEAHGAGLTLEEFDKEIAAADRISTEERQKIIDSGEYAPSYMWNTVGWLADKLNLHIKSTTQVCVPQTNPEDLISTTLNMTIKAGDATGMSAVVTAETEEGITLEAECIGKVYNSEEVDTNEWTIIGEPETTVTVKQPATVELTCADIINRIPDVINAPAGFVPTSRLPELKYRLSALDTYLK